ncbi:MAG: hypothetical protein JSV18_07220 [Candidatus Bathyarchaeota archaeon]|nr:MAG: hypothetical protein JSV18_07220 [Candidatus Bathyarchaeota archaeon]
MIRKTGRRLRDLWIYFKTGHSGYLVYTLSILNFVVLQHRLLISYIPFLSQYMSRLSTFIVIFAAVYIPTAILVGFFEFRKGEVIRRPMLNPYTQETLEANIRMNNGILHYINGDVDEARSQVEESLVILKRWRRDA